MLSKSNRLSRPEFTQFFKIGKRLSDPIATLIYCQSDNFQASVVVGKKVSKLAVVRNSLRRQTYDQIAEFVEKETQPGIYIIITKPAFAVLTKRNRRTAVFDLLARTTKSR